MEINVGPLTLGWKTKDILHVMKFLGHKTIKSTLIYIQLEEAIFKEENDEFICKVLRRLMRLKP